MNTLRARLRRGVLVVIAVISLIAGVLVAMAAPGSVAPAQAVDNSKAYGALAYSPEKGLYGFGQGRTAQEAVTDAAYACVQQNVLKVAADCRSVTWFYHAYGTLRAKGSAWSFGWGATRQEAANGAYKHLPGGKVLLAVQTDSPGNDSKGGVPGRVCLATRTLAVYGLGHAGWAFRTSIGGGKEEQWAIGATENTTGKDLGPGKDNNSWRETGLKPKGAEKVFADGHKYYDSKRKKYLRYADYNYYRCADTASANIGAANTQYKLQKGNGFNGFTNNCLVKAVEVLRSYGKSMPDAQYTSPNYYALIVLMNHGFLPPVGI
jgi:hypothetical protein